MLISGIAFKNLKCLKFDENLPPDRPNVKIKDRGLDQYGAEPIILRYHFGNFVH